MSGQMELVWGEGAVDELFVSNGINTIERKDSEVGEVPNHWEVLPIGDFANVTKLSGFEYTEHFKYIEDGEIIALRALNVREGVLDLKYLKRISKRVSDNLIRSKLFTGDILFTYVGANIGQFAMVEEDDKYHLAPNICRIRTGKKCLSSFLFNYFRTEFFKDNLGNYSVGSSQPTMPMGNIRQILIPVPPLGEQQGIVNVLNCLEEKIKLLHRQNTTLEALAEVLFRQWFVEGTKEEWEGKSLLEVIQLVGGGTPKTSIPEYWDGNIPWLSGGDIASNHKGFATSADKKITELGVAGSSAKLLPKYATVISARGTVGKYCMLARPMAFSQSNYGVLPRYEGCYFFTYLLINHAVAELHSAAYGSVFDTITTTTFQSVSINAPSEDEVADFENKVRPYFQKILTNRLQLETLSNFRDTLLPKLMSGEVRVAY